MTLVVTLLNVICPYLYLPDLSPLLNETTEFGSHLMVHAGLEGNGANFAVGEVRSGRTCQEKLVKVADTVPSYLPNGSGFSVAGISPWYRVNPPTPFSMFIEAELA